MQYCSRCKIYIRGNKSRCPLCEGELTGRPERDVFPVVRRAGVSRMSFLKMASFCFLVLTIILIAVRILAGHPISWIPVTIIAAAVFLGDLVIVTYYRYNFIKMFTAQAYIGIIICFAVDRLTGYHAWSVNWAIPGIFVGVFLINYTVGRASGRALEEYILFLSLDVLLSLLQIIPIHLGLTTFIWPAVVSISFLLVCAAAFVVFHMRELKEAAVKLFNM